jgi:hypothetical protein
MRCYQPPPICPAAHGLFPSGGLLAGSAPYLRTASGCAGRLGVLSILPRAKEAIGL